MSYGVVTTEKPGFQGIVNDDYLRRELSHLRDAAWSFKKNKFICVPFGLSRKFGGMSWWEPQQLINFFNELGELPPNLIVPDYKKFLTK